MASPINQYAVICFFGEAKTHLGLIASMLATPRRTYAVWESLSLPYAVAALLLKASPPIVHWYIQCRRHTGDGNYCNKNDARRGN
jgi:hypothetical protein